MASLYRRASPAQRAILRIVEGAVKNACDAHPHLAISPQHRRSIAKRAAGTLSAQWPEVLAAGNQSSGSDVGSLSSSPVTGRQTARRRPGGERSSTKRFPLRRLIAELARPIRDLKLTGQTERVEAMIEVLRIIHRLRMDEPLPAESRADSPSAASAGNPATDEPCLPQTNLHKEGQ